MFKKILVLVTILFWGAGVYAQDNVGIGTTTPNASAILDLTSTTKGFLPPRMTTGQRDAIATPATGLVIYNTTTTRYEYYNGSGWTSLLGLTSVGLALPSELSVSGSPLTSNGTITATWSNQTANNIFAGPSTGSPAAPTFRALVSDDIPNLNATKINAGTLPVARGGTGVSSATNGQILIGNGTGFSLNTITAGSNINVNNSAGVIEISATGVHSRQHSMTSTDDHTAGNWQVFYSNGSGNVVELSLGTSGSLLKSTGSTSAPTFSGLIESDIPNLNATKINAGTFSVERGGTGASTLTGILKGDGTNAVSGITNTAGNVTYWSDANTIGGVSKLTWDNTKSIFAVDASIRLVPQATAPNSGAEAEGQFYYNDVSNDIKYWNGTAWTSFGGGGGLPSGTTNQTLRYGATDWEATNTIRATTSQVAIGSGTFTPTSVIHSDAGDATAHYHKYTVGTTTGQTATDGFDIGVDASGNAIINQRENLPVILSTNNTERMRIYANGDIGMGTSVTVSPDSVDVQVNGDMRITGDLIVDGNIDPIALILVPQSSAPNTTREGTLYYDNSSNTVKAYNGSAWSDIGSAQTSNIELLNSDNTAKELRLYEPSSSGSDYTAFKAQPQSGNITYTLPSTVGSTGQVLSASDNTGTLVWTNTTGSLPAGSVTNSILTYNGSAWVENVQVLSNSAVMTLGSTTAAGSLRLNDGNGPHLLTINTVDLTANSAYTVPDVGATANFVMSEGTQIINGSKTFSSDVAVKPNTSETAKKVMFYEDQTNGNNSASIKAPADLAADYTLTLPANDGDNGQVITTDGSGILSWTTPASLPTLTQGSMLFSGGGTSILQDNANLFWDDSNNRLGIGTNVPEATVDIVGDFKLGDGGTAIKRIIKTSATLSVSNVTTSAYRSVNVTVNGANTGDNIIVNPRSNLYFTSNRMVFIVCSYVSSSDTVTIVFGTTYGTGYFSNVVFDITVIQ